MGSPIPPKPQGPVSKLIETVWDSYILGIVSAFVKGWIRKIPFSKGGNPTGTQDGPAHKPGRLP